MKKLISCEFNMDTACVELKFIDGSMIAIDTIAMENEVADNMYQRLELDWLIYNKPLEYAQLVLGDDLEVSVKRSRVKRPPSQGALLLTEMAVFYFCGIQHSSGAFAGSSFSAHAASSSLSCGAFCRIQSKYRYGSKLFSFAVSIKL